MTNNLIGSPSEHWIQQSSFIFKGTIRQLRAATMAVIPNIDETAIVKVDEVLLVSEKLGDFRDKEITVQLAELGSIGEEQEAVFFTNSWLYGKSIAVQEVGRIEILPEAQSLAELYEEITNTFDKLADASLKARIDNSEAIVVGRISEVRPLPTNHPFGQDEQTWISEHDPRWREALIRIESVEKGTISDLTATVLFPSSMDVMWYGSPKFNANQEGIWILSRNQSQELDQSRMPSLDQVTYTALEPLDFHPLDQVERIRSLIRENL
jgi:hypothetical protein